MYGIVVDKIMVRGSEIKVASSKFTVVATTHLPGDGRRLGGDAEELLVRPGSKL